MKLCARMLAMVGAGAVLMSQWQQMKAQTVAAPTPSASQRHRKAPKAELFLGYSRFGTGSNNTVGGNRMVGLNGGSASIAFNFNRYVGLVGDFGGYDDSQLQLTGNGVNQPIVANSSGTAYTYLFGPRLSYRNQSRLTPFFQVLAGGVHASAVTVTNCTGTGCTVLPVQSSFAMTGGGGLDIRVTHHVSIRAVQAEYMLTRFAGVTNGAATGTSASQNDLRLSTGLLFGFGGGQALPPIQLACSVQPATVFAGDPVTVTGTATNLNPKRKTVTSWTSSGGAIHGADTTAAINTTGLTPGNYTVAGHVSQGERLSEQAGCTGGFTVAPFDPPSVSCSAAPSSLMPGDGATVTAQATSPQNRPLSYSYTASAGAVTGTTSTASLSTAGVSPGTIVVTCNVVDDLGKKASATASVSVNALPVAAVVAPQPSTLCAISFERDRKRPTRVDNEAKACLDDIALQLQRDPAGKLVIVGNYGAGETPKIGAERAVNERQYLIEEKGVDAGRMEPRVGTSNGRTVTNAFVPAGAIFDDNGSTPVPQP